MIDAKGNPVLPLTKDAVNAVAHCLKTRSPKGWEVRMSGKILKALIPLTVVEKKTIPGHGSLEVELVKDGQITINIEQYRFLRSAVHRSMEDGAAGIAMHAIGYDDLAEAFDVMDAELKSAGVGVAQQ